MPNRTHRAAARNGRRGGKPAKARARGIMKPVQPDSVLGEIVGRGAKSRPELLKGVWRYIKEHRLQDGDDGRVIHPDRKLRGVVGDKSRVSMFELPRCLNLHVH
jgi:chromatin remodeling complex protein RSC6